MKKGQDIAAEFPGLYLVHHNLPGNQQARHSHAEHLLFIPLHGEIRVILDDHRLAAGSGKMIYLPAGQSHAFESNAQQGERLIALVKDSLWKKVSSRRYPGTVLPVNQLLKELLFYLLLHRKSRATSTLVRTWIEVLEEGLEAASQSQAIAVSHLEGKVKDARVRKALLYLRENSAGSFSMNELARKSGLSLRSLNRGFALELGLSPKQVLIQLRIARARELLSSGRVSVTDAAMEVGYRSLSQFITTFRQITGQLPSESFR